MIKKQFTLYLENRPGVLAKVTKNLASAKVNIEGISVSESTDVGLVQMVVSNASAARKLLTSMRIPYTVTDVSMIRLRHEVGALAKVVEKLARQKVNINYVYATGCDCGSECSCYAIISAPNLKKVESACKQ